MAYKRLPAKGDVDPEQALIQAIYALDSACVVAEKINDVEGLLNGAGLWIKVSEAMDEFAAGKTKVIENGELVKSDSKIETGFQRSEPVPDDITVEEENDG